MLGGVVDGDIELGAQVLDAESKGEGVEVLQSDLLAVVELVGDQGRLQGPVGRGCERGQTGSLNLHPIHINKELVTLYSSKTHTGSANKK